MPFFTTSELAKDYGTTPEIIYALAGRINGFFPDGKIAVNGGSKNHSSIYSLFKHRMLGMLLENAPGKTVDEKIEAIYKGFHLDEGQTKMLYQSMSTNQFTKLTNQVADIWQAVQSIVVKNKDPGGDQLYTPPPPYVAPVAEPEPEMEVKTYITKPRPTELTAEFDNVKTPAEAFALAKNQRIMNPQIASNLFRKRQEDQAFDYIKRDFESFGDNDTAYSPKLIIAHVSEFNADMGKEFSKKGSAWLRFRKRLIEANIFQPQTQGFLIYTGPVCG